MAPRGEDDDDAPTVVVQRNPKSRELYEFEKKFIQGCAKPPKSRKGMPPIRRVAPAKRSVAKKIVKPAAPKQQVHLDEDCGDLPDLDAPLPPLDSTSKEMTKNKAPSRRASNVGSTNNDNANNKKTIVSNTKSVASEAANKSRPSASNNAVKPTPSDNAKRQSTSNTKDVASSSGNNKGSSVANNNAKPSAQNKSSPAIQTPPQKTSVAQKTKPAPVSNIKRTSMAIAVAMSRKLSSQMSSAKISQPQQQPAPTNNLAETVNPRKRGNDVVKSPEPAAKKTNTANKPVSSEDSPQIKLQKNAQQSTASSSSASPRRITRSSPKKA